MTFLINTGAWILCAVVGVLLLSNFIRTEIFLAQARKKKPTLSTEDQHETGTD